MREANVQMKEEAFEGGDKGEFGRDPKPRSDLGVPVSRDLPACLPRFNSLKREAVCMLKLTGRRRWSSLRLFLASGCGEERLVGEVRLMTFRTGVLAGVKLVSIFGMQFVATFLELLFLLISR